MTSLWRHLWPNYDTLDFKILTQCVKMLGERVLQVWRWYLHRFRRYRKKTRGGLEIAPPPVGRGIIQVWPSGQITLTGDVIGSGGGTMRYEATMVFRDLRWNYCEAIATKLKITHISWILCLNFNRGTPLVHCDVIGSGSKTEHFTGIVMSTPWAVVILATPILERFHDIFSSWIF